MSNRKIIMGIDTSNYTTSVALMYSDGELIANIKRPLPVKEGEHGLRQSDAVFAHVKNLPSAMREAENYLNGESPSCIAVSTKPRNLEGSYMPCFLSGVAAAESISSCLGIPLYRFSHQCGHLMAAIYSSKSFKLLDGRGFAAFHVSGGTTEMLRARWQGDGFSAELVGGTADLNAGQVIDRIGVKMGLPFPSGKYLEELALTNTEKLPSKKPKISEFKVNLSGLENLSEKLLAETGNKPLVCAFVLDYIGKALILLGDSYEERYGKSDFLFAGGVMSNTILKNILSERFDASFAEPLLSCDNAVGIAYLGLKKFLNN